MTSFYWESCVNETSVAIAFRTFLQLFPWLPPSKSYAWNTSKVESETKVVIECKTIIVDETTSSKIKVKISNTDENNDGFQNPKQEWTVNTFHVLKESELLKIAFEEKSKLKLFWREKSVSSESTLLFFIWYSILKSF